MYLHSYLGNFFWKIQGPSEPIVMLDLPIWKRRIVNYTDFLKYTFALKALPRCSLQLVRYVAGSSQDGGLRNNGDAWVRFPVLA